MRMCNFLLRLCCFFSFNGNCNDVHFSLEIALTYNLRDAFYKNAYHTKFFQACFVGLLMVVPYKEMTNVRIEIIK